MPINWNEDRLWWRAQNLVIYSFQSEFKEGKKSQFIVWYGIFSQIAHAHTNNVPNRKMLLEYHPKALSRAWFMLAILASFPNLVFINLSAVLIVLHLISSSLDNHLYFVEFDKNHIIRSMQVKSWNETKEQSPKINVCTKFAAKVPRHTHTHSHCQLKWVWNWVGALSVHWLQLKRIQIWGVNTTILDMIISLS